MDRDELIDQFSKNEVETSEEIISCAAGPPTASKLRRIIMLLLRGHFSSTDNYMGFDNLHCYKWSDDEKVKTMEVDLTHNESDLNPDKYPGVFVAFGDTTLKSAGIGSGFAGHTQDLAGTHVSKLAKVAIRVNFVFKEAHEAHDMADLASRFLSALALPVIKNAGADSLEILSYGGVAKKKPEPDKYYRVVMPIEISYTHAVTLHLESHRIRRIVQIIATSK